MAARKFSCFFYISTSDRLDFPRIVEIALFILDQQTQYYVNISDNLHALAMTIKVIVLFTRTV